MSDHHPDVASDQDDSEARTEEPGKIIGPTTCVVLQKSRSYLTAKYEGIPENLIICIAGWLVLLLIFTLLRKKAWQYGRVSLVQKYDQRTPLRHDHGYSIWTNLFYGSSAAPQTVSEGDDTSVDHLEITRHVDSGLCAWLRALMMIRDEHVLKKVGKDAVQYLSFQRYLIVYLGVICFISVGIALPVNINGQLRGADFNFGHTTISNLDANSPLLWIHVLLAFLFLPLAIIFMRRYSRSLKIEEQENIVGRTLMIHGIPKDYCQRSTVMQHFQEAYPECEITDIQFAYDVRKLIELDKEREMATHARLWCENYTKETGMRLRMRPFRGGRICVCCGCKQVDALEYYTEEEHALITAVDREQAVALTRPVGIVFLTFQSDSMAEMVYKDHLERWKCTANPPTSSLSRILNPHDWQISFAPPPEDLVWENMTVGRGFWYLRAVFVNLAVFVVLLFVSTPAFAINSLNVLFDALEWEPKGVIFSEILPSFVMLGTSAVLPVIVAYSDEFIYHWTKSGKNHAIMQKTFIFLLFMVIFLPSLGLASISAIFQEIGRSGNQTFKWQCIFLPDNGAFFVNYVIVSGFVGTALELVRFPELVMYLFYLSISRSKAEQVGIQKKSIWEFAFGVHYSYILLIFSMVMVYSLTCPLITPVGVLYMVMKHYVDRYNIYFVYSPSKINKRIHAAAINYVVVALLLLQLSLFLFSIIRVGWSNHTVASLIIFMVMLMIFLAQVFLDWFQHLSPIAYKRLSRSSLEEDFSHFQRALHSVTGSQSDPVEEHVTLFVPVILRRPSYRDEVYTTNANGRTTYGSGEDSIPVSPDRQDVTDDSVSESGRDTDYLYQRY